MGSVFSGRQVCNLCWQLALASIFAEAKHLTSAAGSVDQAQAHGGRLPQQEL